MKKILLSIIVCLASMLFAHNENGDGLEKFENYFFFNTSFGELSKTEFKNGIALQATVGYQMAPFLAITASYYGEIHTDADIDDFEYGFDFNSDKNITNITKDYDHRRSKATFIGLEVNNFLPIIPILKPYIGVGVGTQDIVNEISNIKTEEKDIEIYQIYVGARVHLTNNLAVFGEYRQLIRKEEYNRDSSESIRNY